MPFPQNGRNARHPQRTRSGLTCRALIEGLEQRRLLSAIPLSAPQLHGPMAQTSDPTRTVLAPGSAPSAWLSEASAPKAGAESYTFSVTYRDDVAVRARSIDVEDIRVTGPNGFATAAAHVKLDSSEDGPTRVAHYTINAPGGAWDADDDGRYRIELRPGQVTDVFGVSSQDGILGEFTVALGLSKSSDQTLSTNSSSGGSASNGTSPPIGLNVRNFGAVPDDGIDDTDAIQRAIDSLPDGHGVPGYVPTGGIVYLPAGIYLTSRPLRMHSGITLRGDGPDSIIVNTSTNQAESAILLDSPFAHRYNLGASLQNLHIVTNWTRGISIDPNMGGDVTDLRLANLRISTKGPAIDLRDQAVYFSDFENIEIYNPGSTALHLGRKNDGWGAVNLIRNLSVTGAARSGFTQETALVFLHNHAYVEGLRIATTGANVLPLYVSREITLNGLDIQVPAANCPGGVAVLFNRLNYALIDRITNIGTGRRLMLNDASDVQIGEALSDGTSNVVSQLAIVEPSSSLRIGNAVGGRLQPPAIKPIGSDRVLPAAPARVIDATQFGVIPSNGGDDSAALQRAIDSLRSGGGAVLDSQPAGHDTATRLQTSGGIVQLPHGIINLSTAIKLPSGVWLRGHESGTVLENLTLGSGRAVIELTSTDSTRRNLNAGIMDLMINSGAAAGIRSDATLTNEVRNLRIAGIRIIAGGPSIDLRNVTVNHSTIERVVVYNPGSTALWLGKSDNSGVGNLVRGLRMKGTARPGFVAEKALVVLHGQTRLEGASIEETFTTVLPLYASGQLTMMGSWLEYPLQPNTVSFLMDKLGNSYIDALQHIGPVERLLLINGSNVTIGFLNIAGYTAPLSDGIVVDESSRLTLNAVHAQWDAGWLDHPRVEVRGAFNLQSNRFVDTTAANSGNMVADPNMTDVSDIRVANWTIYWGDNFGSIVGTWAVETVGGEKRLRLTVLSNPNDRQVSVRVKLNVPQSAIGRSGVTRWRVDTARDVFVYTREYGAQYQGRVRNSKTAVARPATITAGEEIWIDLHQAQGTYYIWKVGMVAV